MWFKLNCVLESDHPLPPPTLSSTEYPLGKLQNLLLEYGAEHFNRNGRNPLLYFQILLMSQQFEKAIEYLSGIEQYQVEAVHFAIALYYYGVLRTQLSKQELSQVELKEQTRPSIINFVRLLRQYLGIFSGTDPVDALHYYVLIHDNENLEMTVEDMSQRASLRDQCIRDLVLENRKNEEIILGDGVKIGKIEELLSRTKAQQIAQLAAIESNGNGKYEDAVKFFLLAENDDQVLEIMNTQLSKVFVQKKC